MYLDADQVMALSKTDKGKKKLVTMKDYQKIRWITINPSAPNRAARRQKVRDPLYGFMQNNAQDRTRHKRF